MSEHTPGPWEALPIPGDNIAIARWHQDENGHPTVTYIACSMHRQPSADQRIAHMMAPARHLVADTHLLAAAPDMLAALKGALDAFDQLSCECVDDDIYNAVERAIAKVEG